FYGPKIDIDIEDSQGRKWQLSTVQLDFNIPERFKLKYTDKDGSLKQPVIVHRAIFGTFERFIGILLEHTQGALPTWLSPVQVALLPVSDQFNNFAQKIATKLKDNDIRVEVDESNESVGKKVRNAELQKVPYYVVIGQKEVASGKLSVKSRETNIVKEITLEDFLKEIIA
ncbi:threonine--tRNA ligase, partial [Candidatus Berkelbacteria bacterium]|nr:threonine--tRNA ligase [Candidatus Berkelbacteria bacterium]